jgi:hypothetical protein
MPEIPLNVFQAYFFSVPAKIPKQFSLNNLPEFFLAWNNYSLILFKL